MQRIQNLLDFLFPSLCLFCGEKCSTKIFCEACWSLCELPDPITRCRHCFDEVTEKEKLCKTCRTERQLPVQRAYVFDPESPARLLDLDAVEAMAGFAILQFIQLDWLVPNAVIPMPNSIRIASHFAKDLSLPFVQGLSHSYEYRKDRLEENQVLLLFDVSNPLMNLEKAARSLAIAFPKKIYLLSLFPYVDPVHESVGPSWISISRPKNSA